MGFSAERVARLGLEEAQDAAAAAAAGTAGRAIRSRAARAAGRRGRGDFGPGTRSVVAGWGADARVGHVVSRRHRRSQVHDYGIEFVWVDWRVGRRLAVLAKTV